MSDVRAIRWHFTRGLVAGAPAQKGVYALWDGPRMIYLGRAEGHETIRSCLTAHLRGELACGLRHPNYFSWEISSRPRLLEAQVLEMLGAAAPAPLERSEQPAKALRVPLP